MRFTIKAKLALAFGVIIVLFAARRLLLHQRACRVRTTACRLDSPASRSPRSSGPWRSIRSASIPAVSKRARLSEVPDTEIDSGCNEVDFKRQTTPALPQPDSRTTPPSFRPNEQERATQARGPLEPACHGLQHRPSELAVQNTANARLRPRDRRDAQARGRGRSQARRATGDAAISAKLVTKLARMPSTLTWPTSAAISTPPSS